MNFLKFFISFWKKLLERQSDEKIAGKFFSVYIERLCMQIVVIEIENFSKTDFQTIFYTWPNIFRTPESQGHEYIFSAI